MLRLPPFTYHTPTTTHEATEMHVAAKGAAMYVAGGTDLYPNMKRRHQDPPVVIALNRIAGLAGVETLNGSNAVRIGAMTTLTAVVQDPLLKSTMPGQVVSKAAATISTPILRNMGTIGGNLCLDTRCNYYNQSYEWRKAISFCMKKDGDICWVAPKSPRCWAVQSSDLAPVAVALGATLSLVDITRASEVEASQFYRNDGIDYLTKTPDQILTHITIPTMPHTDCAYWKLRRRGAFDFPVLGVAAWIQWDGNTVADARIVLGGVASFPQTIETAQQAIVGTTLDDDVIRSAAQAAFRPSKPMDNTDFGLQWRKEMTREYVTGALKEIRARRRSN